MSSSRALFACGLVVGVLFGATAVWRQGSPVSAPTIVSTTDGRRPAPVEEATSTGTQLRLDSIRAQQLLESSEREVRRLTQQVARLKRRASVRVIEPPILRKGTADSTTCCEPPPPPPPNVAAPLVNDSQLLQAHAHWDWRAIVHDMLQPWPRIELEQLQSAVAACYDNGTMYCQRMQVYKGSLYLTDYRAIFFDRHYAPARVMPLLETLRRHRDLPDMDLVVAGNDEPRVPATAGDRFSWSRTCQRWPGGSSASPPPTAPPDATRRRQEGAAPPTRRAGREVAGRLPPAIFASTTNRAVLDLPWLDFAWFFPRREHKLRTPPWSKLHSQLVEAGGSVAWGEKIELAMHTGNVMSPHRKNLGAIASRNPGEMLVNELFIGDHGKVRQTCAQLGIHRRGGFQQHKCFMTFAEQCGYKYLLNSASIGYANKFKSLLLCGSVVLYVRDGMRHKEFYEYGLLPGVHYVAVDTAADIPAKVRWLRENDGYAKAVAQAGRARMASLDVQALTDFMAEALREYSRRASFDVKPQPGAVRIECEDDLWRHYSLSRGWMKDYLMHDNETCVHPPGPGAKLGPPGWGGSYAGSKPRCLASHDLNPKAQPEACSFEKPYATGESFEPWGVFPKPHPKDPARWATH